MIAVLTGLFIAFLGGALGLVSGGVGSGAVSVIVLGPVFVGLIWGLRTVSGAVISAMASLALLSMMQGAGLVPEPMIGLGSFAGWAACSLLMICGLIWLWRTRDPIETSSPAGEHDGDGQRQNAVVEGDGQQRRPAMDIIGLTQLDVTPDGRVRARSGDLSLCPSVKIGSDVVLGLPALFPSLDSVPPQWSRVPGGYGFVQKTPVGGWSVIMVGETLLGPLIQEAEQDAAMAAGRARTAFFASLGHDLKNPLNGVIGFADLMDSEVKGPMPEAYKDYPGLIRESGTALLNLVEDILDYAKADAGAFELDPCPVDLSASAQSVVRLNQGSAERAGVRLEFDAPYDLFAMADARAISRILDNLISNAIKYSPPGAAVTVSLRRIGSDVSLSVADEGLGMDEQDLARIAEPFAQGTNSGERVGTGLGLALVRRLSELHGGRTVIRTAPGRGTRVTVSFPVGDIEGQRAAE
ncbi:MAG: HAMP domain-containing sensor histidine kinase [Pseudomonadota bacterium]